MEVSLLCFTALNFASMNLCLSQQKLCEISSCFAIDKRCETLKVAKILTPPSKGQLMCCSCNGVHTYCLEEPLPHRFVRTVNIVLLLFFFNHLSPVYLAKT